MNVALYVLLCAIWGSTWLVIKVGYGGLGPFNVAALRFLVAGGALAVIAGLTGARWPRGRIEWRLVVFVGLVLFGADYGLIYWAEQYIESGLTAILFATLPLITIAFAHLYLPAERLTPRKLTGTLIAFLGVAALFGEHLRLDASKAMPMLAIVASGGCAAATSVATKRHGAAIGPAAMNAVAMLIGGLALLGASWVAGERFRLPADAATWGAVAYLAIVGSVVSFLVYFSLLKIWSVTSLSFISVFTPATALALGVVFLDEQLTPYTVLGAALVLGGVAVALTGRSAARLPDSATAHSLPAPPRPRSRPADATPRPR